MFQNISAEDRPEENKDVEFHKGKMKMIVKEIFTKQNILLYIISFMLSIVNCGIGVSPFGFAIFAAACSNGIPAGIIYVITLVGAFISFGTSGLLTYVLASLLLIAMVLVFRPTYQEEVNEKRKLGGYVFLATTIVQACQMFFQGFMVYDMILSVTTGITVYIFYKIFSNSLVVIDEWGIKKAFSLEEIVGASLMASIALLSLGNFSIFGFEVKNVLSILIVLILGWKNGILLGATSGITIGSVLGILGNGDQSMIAAFALSGMIAGVFSKLGKIGVIFGFIIGTILLTYATNGNTTEIIYLKEILIASLGLLLVPKKIEINIEEFFGKNLYLPTGANYRLEQSKEAVSKLNTVSETIQEMSKAYQEVAATVVEEKIETDNKEKDIFIQELIQNLEGLEENLLYDDLIDSEEIMEDIFHVLEKTEAFTRKDIIEIFEKYHNYIVGFDNVDANLAIEQDIAKIVKVINHTYETGKINYLWKQKMLDNKKTISNQLEGVSKVISSVANEIDEGQKQEEQFKKQQEEIINLCNQKDISIADIIIKREKNKKYIIHIYMEACKKNEIKECPTPKIEKILSKVFAEEIVLQKAQCAMKREEKICKQIYRSKDKFSLQLGMAKKTKDGMIVSGDSSLQIKLDDGKYLIAISDGMGSGPEAQKSSKIAIKMLERLLMTGFDKDISMELMNQSICLNTEEDMYATLDVMILDLYEGNAEFIKNGACPTYIKNHKTVQTIKSLALPAGILDNIDFVTYDRDMEDNEIFLMCSDGILEANTEYQNKEMWVKNLLEQMETENVQKIADIILKEAIDCGYGIAKDDMTIIVGKINKIK